MSPQRGGSQKGAADGLESHASSSGTRCPSEGVRPCTLPRGALTPRLRHQDGPSPPDVHPPSPEPGELQAGPKNRPSCPVPRAAVPPAHGPARPATAWNGRPRRPVPCEALPRPCCNVETQTTHAYQPGNAGTTLHQKTHAPELQAHPVRVREAAEAQRDVPTRNLARPFSNSDPRDPPQQQLSEGHGQRSEEQFLGAERVDPEGQEGSLHCPRNVPCALSKGGAVSLKGTGRPLSSTRRDKAVIIFQESVSPKITQFYSCPFLRMSSHTQNNLRPSLSRWKQGRPARCIGAPALGSS